VKREWRRISKATSIDLSEFTAPMGVRYNTVISIYLYLLSMSVLRETDIYASSHPQLLKNWNAALSRSSCGGLTFWNSLASIELAITSSDRGMLFVPGKRIQNQQHPAVRYIPFTFQYKFRIFFKYLISSFSKNVLSDEVPWPVPSFTTFFISSRTYIQPTSQFNLTQSPNTNLPSIIMHICASYLFWYTLGIIFIIPVLRAYFVNLLDTQYLHQCSANDEHTFIFFLLLFSFVCCACGGSGQLTGHKSLMISSYEILNFLKMTCRPTQKV